MEVENMGSTITSNNKADEDHFPLPGFRFHPTDEELVWFYLRRKIEKRPISVELIKQADIYKYDPWNLPKSSINAGDKEWYFFCKRGRKYKNSIRPNRVTASGFWKATGIDRPIYSSGGGGGGECIGLKKSLVYYRGSAGKGTKTDWMMHEFRLPPKNTNHNAKLNTPQEAEVWTLCRIFKRTSASYGKCTPNLREVTAKKSNNIANPVLIYNNNASSQTCSMDSSGSNNRQSSYISFSNVPIITQNEKKPYSYNNQIVSTANQQFFGNFNSTIVSHEAPSVDSSFTSSINSSDMNELLRHADWEDLRSMMDYAGVGPFYT